MERMNERDGNVLLLHLPFLVDSLHPLPETVQRLEMVGITGENDCALTFTLIFVSIKNRRLNYC